MKNVFAILGATGQQGSGVLNFVTKDPELSKLWTVRAVARNPTSDKAKELAKSVEVVQGDVTDRASLGPAFKGVHTLFFMTTPVPGDAEFQAIKTIADVAVEQNVQRLIFSTLPSPREISKGKYTAVVPFDAKAKGEAYIKLLPIKSVLYCPGYFMENFASQTFLAPIEDPDNKGTWWLRRNMSPNAEMPLIDSTGDGGKWVGAILAEPEKFDDKTVCAAERLYSMTEQAEALSKATGKKVVYKQLSNEDFAKTLPEAFADVFVEYFGYINDYGYFGPGTREKVEWAAQHARGEVSSLEEFFELHPYKLD